MKKVFTVIVTYNAIKWIANVITSLRESSYPTSIIVVDNGSTDGTTSFIQDNYDDVSLILCTSNLGFGRANNVGIKCALDRNADYIFLLNQDAWIKGDTIINLINQASKKSEYGIISPVHLNGKGDKLDVNFSNYVSPSQCPNFYSDLFFDSFKEIYPCNFVNAAAWLISKECIKIVGGFNPFFFMYGEDDEYIERVKYHKFKVGIVPSAIIFHDRECRNVSFDKKRKRAKYEIQSKIILFDLKISFMKAYCKFIKYSFSAFIYLSPSIFKNFIVIHKELFNIVSIKCSYKRANTFYWDKFTYQNDAIKI